MGRVQKKNSKGRLDRYYHLAKEKGYRARSSFKIIQINEKFGHFLEKSKVVIDLCAAPGSWCQVASNLCPLNSLIIGVDIVPIKPLPNCITFQSDITTEDCRSRLRGHMKTWKADTVLHDGAPNVGLGWVQDAFTQSHLTLQALKLAVENLTKGGTFVTKIFRSRDYNNLMWVFQQLFEKVEATKPPASRNVSAEIFVVCKGFKAPRKLDPKLLDPKQVFEEIESKATNNEAKIFDPAKRRRQRSGYEEGDNLLYHEMPLLEFLRKEEPVNTLGGLNRLTTPENTSDHEWRILRKSKLINDELLECIKDLQVLGKKDFKLILKFRKNARELLGLDEKEEEPEVQVEKLSEDQQIDKELEDLSEKQRLKERRLKKQANEKKQKEIYRNQMNMVTDMNVGIEAAQIGSESLFNLRMANKTGQMDSLAKGKKRMIFNDEQNSQDNDINMGDGEVPSSGDEADELEAQLDDMYHSYQQRRNERDANMRAKMARGDDDDQPWDGIKSEEEIEDDENYEREDESSSEDEDDQIRSLVAESKNSSGLSRDAEMFFASNSIFGELDEKSLVSDIERKRNLSQVQNAPDGSNSKQIADVSSGESDFEIVPGEEEGRSNNISDSDSESETHSAKPRTAKESADIATVEAMTLAHQVALGKMSKQDLIDEGINRNWSRDTENLPDWFVDDEKRHSKIVKPITKEAAQAILEKQKQLNARPIKKVLEAQGRKKARALKRLEKLRKKSDLINDDSGKSERDKAEEIQKLMRKLTKKQKQKPKVSVVVAAGANKRLSGRPRGVKGKYKMVDGVLKNESRALKRIAKKHKK